MLLESSEEYMQETPETVIEDSNHNSRNALSPAFISVGVLKRNLEKLSSEQIKKHLENIENSLNKELEIIEHLNHQVSSGNILIFRKRKR